MRQRGLSVIEKQYHMSKFGGQNTTIRDTALPLEQGDIAQNCRLDEVGSVTKRELLGKLNATALGTSPVTSLYRYYQKGGSIFWFSVESTDINISSGDTGTFTSAYTLGTSGTTFTFVTYNDLCIMSDGTNNVLESDGDKIWELGACKAGDATSGGSLDGTAVYKYQIVFNTAADGSGTDTINGAISNSITTTGSNKTIPLTNIPLGDTNTASRVIYRTEGGGSTYKKESVIGNNTATTYTDNTADGSLGAAISSVTDDMPKGKYLLVSEERLFITGNSTYPNAVFYSDTYKPAIIWTGSSDLSSVEMDDYYDYLGKDESDEIVGFARQLGLIYVFKKQNIRPYHIRGVPAQWILGQPVSHSGCPAPYSIVETQQGIMYQGWDHFYVFNGVSSAPLIDEFPVREEILLGRMTNTVGFYHRNVYRFAYTDAKTGQAEHNRVGIYNVLRKQFSVDVINVRCFAARTGDDETGDIYMGDSKALGWIYVEESSINYMNLKTKTDLDAGTYDDCRTVKAPTEELPQIEVSWDLTIDEASGDIDTGYATSIIDRFDKTGVYTSDIYEINASRFDKLYWHERLGSGDNVTFDTRTGSSESAVGSAGWDTGLTEPSGSTIASSANSHFQFRANLTSGVITQTPLVYRAGDFVVRVGYYSYTAYEATVPFIYRTGYRNLEEPHIDKWFKKIIIIWESDGGTVDVSYDIDRTQSYTFTGIDSVANQYRWETYFPSEAYGRTIRFQISKDDAFDFRLKEILVIWTPQPII